MTLSLEIVKLLADNKPRTLEEIAAAVDQPLKKVRNSLNWLRRREMTDAAFVYRITANGATRSVWRPKTLDEIADTNEKNRLKRLTRFTRFTPQDSQKSDTMVAQALKNQPALQSAWGAPR